MAFVKRLGLCTLLCVLLLLPVVQAAEEREPEQAEPNTPIDLRSGVLWDREGDNWYWSGRTRTLTLYDGLQLHTGGTCIQLPQRATLIVQGEVTLASDSGDGIVLPERTTLSMSAGSILRVTAAGDGIQGHGISLSAGNLEITAGGACLNVLSGNLELGSGLTAALGGAGTAIQAAQGSVTLSGEIALTAQAGGVLAQTEGKSISVSETAQLSIRASGAEAPGMIAGGRMTLAGETTLEAGGLGLQSGGAFSATAPLQVTAGVDGIQAGGAASFRETLSVSAGGSALTAGGNVTGEDAALTLSGASGLGLSTPGSLTLTGCTLKLPQAGGIGLSVGKGAVFQACTLQLGQVVGDALVLGKDLSMQETALTVESAGGDGIKAEGAITIQDGSLTLGQAKGGLSAGKDITLSETQILLGTLEEDGINATGGLMLQGGSLALEQAQGGLLAGRELSVTQVQITLGTLSGDGMNAAGALTIQGGSLALEQAQGGLLAGQELSVTEAQITLGTLSGDGMNAAGALAMQDVTLTLSKAGGSGFLAGGKLSLERVQITTGPLEGYGARSGDTFLLDKDSSLTIASAGEHGVYAARLVTADGMLTLSQVGGTGILSTSTGVRLGGTVTVNAQGNGIEGALAITSSGALNLTAGGDGILSQKGMVTLSNQADQKSTIEAGGIGIRSADQVSLSQPGDLTITAGGIGVWAQKDVAVGGMENQICNLAITSGAESIWSETGNVALRACDKLYRFDSPVHVNSEAGKTLSVLEGAGLLCGMKNGTAFGILRKDCTITPDLTPELLDLRTLQIGSNHTVIVAPGAKLKIGPVILGTSARLVTEPGSQLYYNGPTSQVTGPTQSFPAAPVFLTAGTPAAVPGGSWDGSTLTLNNAVIDVAEGPALRLPAGSTIRVTGEARLNAGSGPVVQCDGPLTITGGSLQLSGGEVGIQAAGPVRAEGTKLAVRGTSEAAVSATGFTAVNTALECHGDGVPIQVSGGTISIEPLPEGVTLAQVGGVTVLQGENGAPVTSLSAVSTGSSRQTQKNPDGSTTVTETDPKTGAVQKTTTNPDGTVTQTRSDGVAATLTGPAGQQTASVTLPAGVEQTVLRLPAANPGPDTVAMIGDKLLPWCGVIDGMLAVQVEESGDITFSNRAVSFQDVPEGAWFAGPVAFAASRNLFLGTGEGQFSPNSTMTCEMAAAVLYRLAGSPEQPGEDDITRGTAWVVEQGIADGIQDSFDPQAPVTRELLAAMLYRSAGIMGVDTQARSPLSAFTDGDSASSWAAIGLRWAVANGILKGRGSGILDPGGTASRAEVAAMLQRFVSLALQ